MTCFATIRRLAMGLVMAGALAVVPAPALARQDDLPTELARPPQPAPEEQGDLAVNMEKLIQSAVALPIATALGSALALRPRRRGTPKRSTPIVQTQIILAVIGALVMLVVGSSLARAFGVVGAAGLVRYRARVQDPKDAGVMLSTLAVGLSSGVGLYFVSMFATGFIMAVLWVIESFEPRASKFFILKIGTKQARSNQRRIEEQLRHFHAALELRTSSEEELSYEVRLPAKRGTDYITKALLAIDGVTAVDWDEEKKKPDEIQ